MLATNKERQSIKGKGPKNPQNLLNILYIHPCSKSTPQIPNGIPILNSFFSLFSSFVFFLTSSLASTQQPEQAHAPCLVSPQVSLLGTRVHQSQCVSPCRHPPASLHTGWHCAHSDSLPARKEWGRKGAKVISVI